MPTLTTIPPEVVNHILLSLLWVTLYGGDLRGQHQYDPCSHTRRALYPLLFISPAFYAEARRLLWLDVDFGSLANADRRGTSLKVVRALRVLTDRGNRGKTDIEDGVGRYTRQLSLYVQDRSAERTQPAYGPIWTAGGMRLWATALRTLVNVEDVTVGSCPEELVLSIPRTHITTMCLSGSFTPLLSHFSTINLDTLVITSAVLHSLAEVLSGAPTPDPFFHPHLRPPNAPYCHVCRIAIPSFSLRTPVHLSAPAHPLLPSFIASFDDSTRGRLESLSLDCSLGHAETTFDLSDIMGRLGLRPKRIHVSGALFGVGQCMRGFGAVDAIRRLRGNDDTEEPPPPLGEAIEHVEVSIRRLQDDDRTVKAFTGLIMNFPALKSFTFKQHDYDVNNLHLDYKTHLETQREDTFRACPKLNIIRFNGTKDVNTEWEIWRI